MADTAWTGLPQVRRAMDFFQAKGWSPAQAAGIVANLHQESGLNPDAYGDHYLAYGVGQWHPDRQNAFREWSGTSIYGSPLEQQLGFVHHELTDGAWKGAGDALRAANTPQEAGSIVSQRYEIPADRDGEAARRAIGARDLSESIQAST